MMLEKYETLADTTPHEQHMLILSESYKFYGSDCSDLASEIAERVIGNELTIREEYVPLDSVKNNHELVENSIWIIHWEECLRDGKYPYLEFILSSRDFPDSGEAIICVENGGHKKTMEIKEKYKRISAVYSEETLLSTAEMRMNDINPHHRRGKEKLKEWNNEAYETVNG